ncbi:MAG: GDP-mannose 4,6-dehydratase [Acidobacteriota bacterium]|nr:GDP-mannose 4,6-dehydratase [Acidobacteriota bacterium]
MKVLISGVSGFLGVALAQRLAADGCAVFGTHIGDEPSIPGVSSVDADLLDPAALARAVDWARPDVVIHLAGLSHVGDSRGREEEYWRVNVTGTENMLRAATGRRVLFASSAQVYGPVPPESQPIREQRRPQPQNPYAETKAAAERLVLTTQGTVVRLFNVVGRGQARSFALPSFAHQLASLRHCKDAVIEVGDLSPRRDFLPLEDAIDGYACLMEHGEPATVYNLGSGVAVSVAEALELLMDVSGVRPSIEVDETRLRKAEVPLLCADISRLRSLGWEPRTPLREALQDLWASVAEADPIS